MKKNVFLIILSVLLVLAIGVSVYLVLKYRKTNTSLQTENTKNSDLTKERDDLKTQLDTVKSNQNTTTNTNTNNSIDVKTVEVNKFVPFDPSKVKNKLSNQVVNRQDKFDRNGLYVKIDDNGNVYLYVTSKDSLYNSSKMELSKEYQVTGFSGKVVDVFLGYEGQGGVDYPLILFLMEDGSVEYLNAKQAVENLDFKSNGKLNYLSNIVRFEEASIGTLSGGGYVGVVAIDSDGYSYIVDGSNLNK